MYTFAIALPLGHAQIGNLSESSLLKKEQNPFTNGLLCWKVSPWFHPTIQLAVAKFLIQNAFRVLYIMCMIRSLYAKKTTAKNQSHLFASILAYLQHWLSLYALLHHLARHGELSPVTNMSWSIPDTKVHRTNPGAIWGLGPTWGPSGPTGPRLQILYKGAAWSIVMNY